MRFGAAWFLIVFVSMVVIGFTNADQQKPSYCSFLSTYDSYRNICRKIGWEPKCRKQPITSMEVYFILRIAIRQRHYIE